MQRPDSCDDQEREVRRDLLRYGVDPTRAVVLKDEAESATRHRRDGFETLCEMIRRGEVGVLAADDQSRLSRADNASQFICTFRYFIYPAFPLTPLIASGAAGNTAQRDRD